MTSLSSSSTGSALMLYGLEQSAYTILSTDTLPLLMEVEIDSTAGLIGDYSTADMLAEIDDITGATADEAENLEQIPIGEPVFARVHEHLETEQVLVQVERRKCATEIQRIREEAQTLVQAMARALALAKVPNQIARISRKLALMEKHANNFAKTVGAAESAWRNVLIVRTNEIDAKKAQKNVKKELTHAAERRFNKLASVLRTCYKIPKEIMPNACKGHQQNARRQHQAILRGWDASLCLINQDDDGSIPAQVLFHKSRRISCSCNKESMMACLTEYLRRAKLGDPIGLNKFGSFDLHAHSVAHQVLIPCECRAPRTSAFCGKFIWALDPKLLEMIPSLEERERWLSIVQQKRDGLIMVDFPTAINYCPDHACPMSNSGFIVEALLTGQVGGVHNRRECPTCAKTWCGCCKQAPFHRTVCPGPITLDPTLSEEEKKEFCNRYKSCAQCQILTERIDGCAHMSCTVCSTHWCWRCRGVRDKHDPYSHVCPIGFEYDTRPDINDHG